MTERLAVIFDFAEAGEVANWYAINDGVMGGMSRGGMQATSEGTAAFTGHISLQNNGGFASVRSRPAAYDLAGFDGIALRVRGDGKGYKLRLRTDPDFDGVTYEAAFTPERDTWAAVRVPLGAFVPVFRGRMLSNVPPLDPSQIKTLGLLVSDKQQGPFRLEIAWIAAYATEL